MKEKYLFTPPKPKFTNKTIDKKELKRLMAWAFSNYGTGRASYLADKLKDLGFHYATRAGLSLSVEDLRVPPTKRELLERTNTDIYITEQQYERGEITTIERFQRVIDTWNNASEELKDEVVTYFRETDPLNPIYIMAFSGARGNISQVRQLVGMRGLMADPQGQIIDLPIKSNFREGLTVTEYIISSYGARKGLVDTALRTADSGYLTRRLVDVAQDIIIREIDCDTDRGIVLQDMVNNNQLLIPLQTRLLGRVLFETLYAPDSANVLAHINQDLDYDTAESIVQSGLKSVIVRSPLTCESSRSVCQFCYGWNLAHGALVDLGEAVGIIAAQSIGEPGTQLTMRTFHTGGVFTGELAEQVRAPFDGVLRLPKSLRTRLIRTRHGGEAFVLEENYKLSLYNLEGSAKRIEFKQGTLLFLTDNQQFRKSQIIGEVSTKGTSITERATKDLVSEISGEVTFSDLSIEERIDRQGNVTTISSKGGLLWILSGDVYNIPSAAVVDLAPHQNLINSDIIAKVQVRSDYGGIVRLSEEGTDSVTDLKIMTTSLQLNNASVIEENPHTNSEESLLHFQEGDKFKLLCSNGDKISNHQVIAECVEPKYEVSTGGILKYGDLTPQKYSKGDKGGEFIGAGSFFWIPEETHEINKDISLLLVEGGEYIEAGTFILKDIITQLSGYVEIVQENEIVREVIIKPGTLISIPGVSHDVNTEAQLLKPGDHIPQVGPIEDYSFLEVYSESELLLRPVIQYDIPDDILSLDIEYLAGDEVDLHIYPVRRILYDDGQRVKTNTKLTLLKTCLVVDINSEKAHISADSEFLVTNENVGERKFHLTILETLQINPDTFGEANKPYTKSSFCVKDGEHIRAGSIVAETALLCQRPGIVHKVVPTGQGGSRVLILTDDDKETINIGARTPQVTVGDLVKYGDQIAIDRIAQRSGQVLRIDEDSVTIRSGRPYLVSSNAILQINNSDLVQLGDTLAILVFERSKTGDIVQGLPRIEEILEARKPKEPAKLSQRPGKVQLGYDIEENRYVRITETDGFVNEYPIQGAQKLIISNGDNVALAEPLTDGAPNPHEMLNLYFTFYRGIMTIYEAAKLSLQKVQIYLVNEVQNVYQSQNVDISDKHIEVIVRQMTSKVKVEDGGDTTLLPGELVELHQIENINEAMTLTKGAPATYCPILLGITKSSLNTDSFISAASFQETTRVLTEAAIEGKADWLRGLKENVIIGRLIPAGTGFNSYSDPSKNLNVEKRPTESVQSEKNSMMSIGNLTDMILDDSIARAYQSPVLEKGIGVNLEDSKMD
nr:RNA polymerase beta'' subunit [Proteomonas sp. NIES-1005]